MVPGSGNDIKINDKRKLLVLGTHIEVDDKNLGARPLQRRFLML